MAAIMTIKDQVRNNLGALLVSHCRNQTISRAHILQLISILFCNVLWFTATGCAEMSDRPPKTHMVETMELTEELISWGGVGGVSVDLDGNVVLSNFNKHVWSISQEGEVNLITDELSLSSGNTVLSNGAILQADFGRNSIFVLDRSKGVIATFSDTGLDGPVGIDEAPNGDVFVANYQGGYIARIPEGGGVAKKFAEYEKMKNPNGLIIDDQGNIFVADLESSIIFKFDSDGVVEEFADLPGTGNGHIAIANGALYVTQLMEHQIVRLEFDGSYSIAAGNGTPGVADGVVGRARLTHPNGIAADQLRAALFFNGHRGTMQGGERGNIALRKITGSSEIQSAENLE